jgi:hypothetical protein
MRPYETQHKRVKLLDTSYRKKNSGRSRSPIKEMSTNNAKNKLSRITTLPLESSHKHDPTYCKKVKIEMLLGQRISVENQIYKLACVWYRSLRNINVSISYEKSFSVKSESLYKII